MNPFPIDENVPKEISLKFKAILVVCFLLLPVIAVVLGLIPLYIHSGSSSKTTGDQEVKSQFGEVYKLQMTESIAYLIDSKTTEGILLENLKNNSSNQDAIRIRNNLSLFLFKTINSRFKEIFQSSLQNLSIVDVSINQFSNYVFPHINFVLKFNSTTSSVNVINSIKNGNFTLENSTAIGLNPTALIFENATVKAEICTFSFEKDIETDCKACNITIGNPKCNLNSFNSSGDIFTISLLNYVPLANNTAGNQMANSGMLSNNLTRNISLNIGQSFSEIYGSTLKNISVTIGLLKNFQGPLNYSIEIEIKFVLQAVDVSQTIAYFTNKLTNQTIRILNSTDHGLDTSFLTFFSKLEIFAQICKHVNSSQLICYNCSFTLEKPSCTQKDAFTSTTTVQNLQPTTKISLDVNSNLDLTGLISLPIEESTTKGKELFQALQKLNSRLTSEEALVELLIANLNTSIQVSLDKIYPNQVRKVDILKLVLTPDTRPGKTNHLVEPQFRATLSIRASLGEKISFTTLISKLKKFNLKIDNGEELGINSQDVLINEIKRFYVSICSSNEKCFSCDSEIDTECEFEVPDPFQEISTPNAFNPTYNILTTLEKTTLLSSSASMQPLTSETKNTEQIPSFTNSTFTLTTKATFNSTITTFDMDDITIDDMV